MFEVLAFLIDSRPSTSPLCSVRANTRQDNILWLLAVQANNHHVAINPTVPIVPGTHRHPRATSFANALTRSV